MRAFLYDLLTTSTELQEDLGGAVDILERVLPRRSQENINIVKPFLVYGMGNATSELLEDSTADDARAERQFFQIWVHDEGDSFVLIDQIVEKVKNLVTGASDKASNLLTVRYLETSAEFSNETYNTLFRYIRFQGIIAEERTST